MSDAAPPTWIKRAHGLSAAHKFMLSVLWGYGPYRKPELWVVIDGDEQPRKPARCWESAPELAKMTDQPVATVRNQLRKLAADGWILRGTGTMRTLAWRAPRVFTYGEGVATGEQGVATGAPVQIRRTPDHERRTPNHECTGGVTTGDNQTLQLTSNTSNNSPPTPAETVEQSQLELGAEPPPPSDHLRLRELHEQLRKAALVHHGDRATSLPGASTKSGKSLDKRLRSAIRTLGTDECERVLRWRHGQWVDDAGQLSAYSTHCVWSSKSMEKALEFMGKDWRPPLLERKPEQKPGEPEFANRFDRQRWREAETRREHEAYLATLPPEERATVREYEI